MNPHFRLLSLAILIVAGLMLIAPASAQDDLPTLAEILAGEGEDAEASGLAPEFATLLAEIRAADPAVWALLSDPDANITFFAPTDSAFEALLSSSSGAAANLFSADALTNLLYVHIVPGVFTAEALTALDGAFLGTRLPDNALAITTNDDEGIMIGVAQSAAHIVTADIAASNGIIHVIDAVLIPQAANDANNGAGETLADLLVASAGGAAPEFTTLLAAAQSADPSLLAMLSGESPYTVFAPTDAAFAATLAILGITSDDLVADTDLLTTVLAYHIVPGSISSSTLRTMASDGDAALATSLPGSALALSVSGGTLRIGGAVVTAADQFASNGVLHVIDTLLLPTSGG